MCATRGWVSDWFCDHTGHQTGQVVVTTHWPGCCHNRHNRLAWLLSQQTQQTGLVVVHQTGLVVVTTLAWLDWMSHAAWLHALWLRGCQFNPTGLFYSDFSFGVNQSLKESKFQRITHCFVTLTETRSKSLMDLFSCGKTFTCICFLLFDSGWCQKMNDQNPDCWWDIVRSTSCDV